MIELRSMEVPPQIRGWRKACKDSRAGGRGGHDLVADVYLAGMDARHAFALISVMAFVQLRASDDRDSLRGSQDGNWRIGLNIGYMRFIPSNQEDPRILSQEEPTFAWGIYPFQLGSHDTKIDGRYTILLPGVILNNARHTAISISFGTSSVNYRSVNGSFPIFHTKEHWLLRTEYTRSTRPALDPQRPRFGFRYGCALTLAKGSALRESEWSGSSNSGYREVAIATTLVRIQPTLQFGYRSRGLNAGIQVYLNLLAYVEGSVHQTGRRREGFEVFDTDEVLRVKDMVFVDRLTQEGFLGSYFQLYLSVPLIGIGSQRSKLREPIKTSAP